MEPIAASAVVNPFRGPRSFNTTDEDLFFGRRKEVKQLLTMIQDNQLTLLFGSSGTGKTSLIRAKLLPELERLYYHPIYIRINFASGDPLEFTRQRILKELRGWEPDLPDFQPGQTLIEYAARVNVFQGLVKPVLFFDQFEELFTLGYQNDRNTIEKFLKELGDLIEIRVPVEKRSSESLANVLKFKVVLSLRQDWVAYLDDYREQIPSLLQNRFRLKRFVPSQALEAILRTANSSGREVISEATARKIIKNIGSPSLLWDDNEYDPELKNLVVDPFILSSYCSQLYDLILTGEYKVIDDTLIGKYPHSTLFRTYYERCIKTEKEIGRLLENRLLNDAGIRVQVPLTDLLKGSDITEKQLMETAERNGLIRLTGPPDSLMAEISHDQLAKQIFESRKEREAKENEEWLNKETILKNREAEEKNKKAEEERVKARKFKRYTILLIVATIIILLVVLGGTFIYIRNNTQVKNLQNTIQERSSVITGMEKELTFLRQVNKNLSDTLNLYNGQISSLKYDTLVKGNDLRNSIRRENDFIKERSRLITDKSNLQVLNEITRTWLAALQADSVRLSSTLQTSRQEAVKYANDNTRLKADTTALGRAKRQCEDDRIRAAQKLPNNSGKAAQQQQVQQKQN